VAAPSAPARGPRPQRPASPQLRAGAGLRALLALGLAAGTTHGAGQDLHYIEPGLAGCPSAPAPTAAAPRTVVRGQAVAGRLSVTCGFGQGSYTVTLAATDAQAVFVPRSFIVNFGRVVGDGAYAVTFSTVGIQRLSATITSNMGSPPVRGGFVGRIDTFNVVGP
jgi:hypothetical protein